MIEKCFVTSKQLRVVAAIISLFVISCAEAKADDALSVPSCFTAPPRLMIDGSFILPRTSDACDELDKILVATDQKDVAWIPGAGLNAILGLDSGGFAAGSYALQFRVSQRFNQSFVGQDELVRFAKDEARARGGSWWTTLEAVSSKGGQLVNSADLATRLALPQSSMPQVVAYSSGVAIGTLGYFGVVAPAFGRSGGAVQFWFPSEPVFTEKTQPFQD
jgi:hypothetical protein